MSDFNAELELANRAGVNLPENLPFLLKPRKSNGQAVLLIHGFCASPYEMRPLGEYLCKRGYLSWGVRLAGHGTNSEDLRSRSWQDWLASAERGLSALQKTGLPITIIGQSTGALLSLVLVRHHRLARMVLLSPFLKLRHPLSGITGLLKHIIPFAQRSLPDPQRRYYYERRPLSGIEQIGLLRKEIEPTLASIEIPALVLAASGDQTVSSGTGRKLFDQLGSQPKAFHLYGPEVPHVLSSSENPLFDETCQRIETFISDGQTSSAS